MSVGIAICTHTWKRAPGHCAAACVLLLAPVLCAAEPALVKLAVTEGKDIRFSHLIHKDGLAPGQIHDILQDDQGFLWFNTSGFLNRYDGYQFKSYTRDAAHPNYPAGTSISTIFKDRTGYLWVSSNEEVARFDPVTETSTRFPIDHDGPRSLLGPVSHISQDRSGTLWFATPNGLYRLDATNGAFRHYSHDPSNPASLASSEVRSTYEDRAGTLWVCTPAGVDGFDPRTEKVTERIPWTLSTRVIEDRAGVLWIIYSTGNGLASWDRHSRRLTVYSFKDREPPPSELSGAERIYEDGDSNLWLTTYGTGLVKINPSRVSAVQYRFSRRPNSIDMDSVTALFEDREGTVWLGVAGGGVNKFRRRPLPFQRWVVDPGAPLEPFITLATSVYVDRQENVWVGSPIGLLRIDGKTGAYTLFNHSGPPPANISNVFVTSMVEDRSGYLWIGTYGGGLNRYDPRTRRFTLFRHNPADPSSLSHDLVYSLAVDHNGTLWAGTADGLNRCDDPATGRFRSWRADPAGNLRQEVPWIVEDSSGMLWLASRTLQRFDPATGRFTAYTFNAQTGKAEREASSTLVRSGTSSGTGFLTIGRSGLIWAATTNGLLRFDPQRDLATTYDERDGLPSRAVISVLEDHTGNVWAGTAGGLSRFNPTARMFTNYYETDGLASEVFDGFPVAYQTPRGQMFFGSVRGVTSFWPDQIVEKPSAPPVVFTGFSLLNKRVEPSPGSVLPKSVTFTRSLTLSHDQNIFSFEFAALSFLDPPRNQYRYMLEGLTHSWSPVDPANRTVTFTTLPAGDYTLRVQGSNNRGVWNEQGLVLQLKILPPWWETWWFRALCVALVAALIAALYRFRLWQIQQEARRLRDVIEAIPAYVWSALPDGFVDFVNRRWLEFSGFSLDQAKGWGWADALHPEDRGQLLEAFRAAIASGTALEAEARMCSADGQYRWLLFRSVPQRDASGKIVKWYGKSMDIDDRKRAEETLRETETRFRTYIDHATDAFFVLDFEGGTILDANRRACENLGCTREELVGKRMFEFDAALDPEFLNQNIQARIEVGESVTFETRHRRKDGSEFPVEIRARAFRSGGRIYNLSLALDITERKRAEEERERMHELEADLAHMNRVSMMGELSASIAHEVNQPLTGIVSNGGAGLRMLAGDAPDMEEIREILQDMVRDGRRAGDVIKRIRALTKRTELPREKLDLNETIREVLALVGDEAKKNGVTVRTQFADEVSPVHGDRVQLQQVLLNLVMNAIQAMSSVTDRARQLAIRTRSVDEDQVQVTVEDSGIGIDPDKIGKIFQPFFTTKSSGMGMGLSICRSILEKHGGRLWATANEGPGASFHFTLPKHAGEASNAGAAAD